MRSSRKAWLLAALISCVLSVGCGDGSNPVTEDGGGSNEGGGPNAQLLGTWKVECAWFNGELDELGGCWGEDTAYYEFRPDGTGRDWYSDESDSETNWSWSARGNTLTIAVSDGPYEGQVVQATFTLAETNLTVDIVDSDGVFRRKLVRE